MISDTAIKQKGFEVLKEKLGIVEMERFIMLINREKFDYTKWRKDLFEDMDIEELSNKANEFSKGL
ncbi:MAG: hypothetical protein QNL62_19165 [Gammaproteobacteria bacterium]|nr:hypothetical protein [Gammaproteobacteria bacterium]